MSNAEAEQVARELLERELWLMMTAQGEEDPTGITTRWFKKLQAGMHACADCLTEKVEKIINLLAMNFMEYEQLLIAEREAEAGKNIAAAIYFNDASLAEIERMLADGADVNRRLSFGKLIRGRTALMQVDELEEVRLLLAEGAKVNAQDFDRGETALHKLMYVGGNTEAVAALLAYGAKVDIKNKSGETPPLIARQVSSKVIKALVTNAQQWREEFFASYAHQAD